MATIRSVLLESVVVVVFFICFSVNLTYSEGKNTLIIYFPAFLNILIQSFAVSANSAFHLAILT